ncbi:hypothetical protein LCGC14_1147860 [marine sediment metagenome]|uniref:Uncharacterized protein n=1 Tax=marine sediment metagenome TaxID=412755 RepID=A0A0F9LWF3_9ZZZZ
MIGNLALVGYLHQELILLASWEWGQVFSWVHHETIVIFIVGLALATRFIKVKK